MRSSWFCTAALVLAAPAAMACSGHGQMEPSVRPTSEADATVVDSSVPFDSLMAQAMDRMHAGMAAVPAGGSPDHAFLAMMLPHHQGAVEMARGILLHTGDPRIRNLAQSIIAEQQYEIELMQALLRAEAAIPNPKEHMP